MSTTKERELQEQVDLLKRRVKCLEKERDDALIEVQKTKTKLEETNLELFRREHQFKYSDDGQSDLMSMVKQRHRIEQSNARTKDLIQSRVDEKFHSLQTDIVSCESLSPEKRMFLVERSKDQYRKDITEWKQQEDELVSEMNKLMRRRQYNQHLEKLLLEKKSESLRRKTSKSPPAEKAPSYCSPTKEALLRLKINHFEQQQQTQNETQRESALTDTLVASLKRLEGWEKLNSKISTAI